VHGKILPLLIAALLISAVLSEVTVRFVLGYPDYGIEKFIYGISSSTKWQPQYRPYSRYLNNEVRGFNVFSRNNLGLPGTDIDLRGRPVFILGSSFIEASQICPELIASSVCQRIIEDRIGEYSFYNLGRKAHDLYDSWFRYSYYKRIYPPDTIILILDQRNSFQRHKLPLDFTLPNGFGKVDNRLITRCGNLALSSSAFMALLYRGFREVLEQTRRTKSNLAMPIEQSEVENNSRVLMLSYLKQCLDMFATEAKDKIVVISIFDQANMNREIDAWCDSLGLFHVSSDHIQIPQLQLGNRGHFIIEGNAKLGEFMANSFFSFKRLTP